MSLDRLPPLSTRRGHFRTESGLHADEWTDLASLFVDAAAMEPAIEALGSLLRPHRVDAICGPLVGGAFLAQRLAQVLGVDFLYAERTAAVAQDRLFAAAYVLPPAHAARGANRRVAIVDDAVSAGSSVRATAAALEGVGATVVAIGALLSYGRAAIDHFAARDIPVLALSARPYHLWTPAECPLCAAGLALTHVP